MEDKEKWQITKEKKKERNTAKLTKLCVISVMDDVKLLKFVLQ